MDRTDPVTERRPLAAQRPSRAPAATGWSPERIGAKLPAILLVGSIVGGVTLLTRLQGGGDLRTRLSLTCMVLALAYAATNTRFVVPALIVALGPMEALGHVYHVNLGQYPFYPTSAVVWLLCTTWVLRHRAARSWQPGTLDTAVILLSLLSAVGGLGALAAAEGERRLLVTAIVYITGVLEPLGVLLLVRSWLSRYGDWQLMVSAFFAAVLVGLVLGIVGDPTAGRFDERHYSIWRMSLSALGTANLLGFMLVIIYPLGFLVARQGRQFGARLAGGFAVLAWATALASLSRATPAVMLVQTGVMLGLRRSRTWAAVAILCSVLGIGLTIGRDSSLVKVLASRITETQFVGYVTGQSSAQISRNDRGRAKAQRESIDYMVAHPAGGYGAQGQEGPESLYLSVAVQLGWISLLSMIGVHLVLLARASGIGFGGKVFDMGDPRPVRAMVIGAIIYAVTTGADLSKVNIFGGSVHVSANCSLVHACVIGLVTWWLTARPRTANDEAAEGAAAGPRTPEAVAALLDGGRRSTHRGAGRW